MGFYPLLVADEAEDEGFQDIEEDENGDFDDMDGIIVRV